MSNSCTMPNPPPPLTLPPSYATLPYTSITLSHVPSTSPAPTPTIIVTLNRPQKYNAFTETMSRELEEAFTLFDVDDRVKCVVVTGAGRMFCAGADLQEGLRGGEERVEEHRDRSVLPVAVVIPVLLQYTIHFHAVPTSHRARFSPFCSFSHSDMPTTSTSMKTTIPNTSGECSGGRVTLAIHRCRKPTIGALNGSAVGIGITMTLAMSIRIAYAQAKIGFVFARRGLIMEAASSFFLPRLVG